MLQLYDHLFFPQQDKSIEFNINDFLSIMYPSNLQKPILEEKQLGTWKKKGL